MPACRGPFEAQPGTEPGEGGGKQKHCGRLGNDSGSFSVNLVVSIPSFVTRYDIPDGKNKAREREKNNKHQDTIVSTCSGQTFNILLFLCFVFLLSRDSGKGSLLSCYCTKQRGK